MAKKQDSAQREKDLFQSPRTALRNRKLGDKFRQNNAVFELPEAESDRFFNSKMQTIEDLIGPQFCSLCDRNIAQSVKIRSKEHDSVGSSGKPIIICLECHRSGVTIGSNLQRSAEQNQNAGQAPGQSGEDKKDVSEKPNAKTIGDYAVMDNLQFQLFHQDWTAREELFLLQGVMKCGMGNWIDISEQYVKSKSAADCEEHYFTFYYKSKEQNMPEESDCVITGPREINCLATEDVALNSSPKVNESLPMTVQITVPVDTEKSVDAEERVKRYRI